MNETIGVIAFTILLIVGFRWGIIIFEKMAWSVEHSVFMKGWWAGHKSHKQVIKKVYPRVWIEVPGKGWIRG